MITLYHSPFSLNSRRVWIALLEKGLTFELVDMDLSSGVQFKPEFLALNPFHHVPVLVDGERSVVESLAILDYLEAKYPTPVLMPSDPDAIAQVRMVEMVTINELIPAARPLMRPLFGFGDSTEEEIAKAKQQVGVALGFYETTLQQHPFFGGDHLTLADIVLGTAAAWFSQLGIGLDEYPQLQAWLDRILARESWSSTAMSAEALEGLKARMQAAMAKRQG